VSRSQLEIVHYGDLTWPEVAELPRDQALVLPLGSGYDLAQVAQELGVDDLCLLPRIPYGWDGSLVPLEPELFAGLLTLLQAVVWFGCFNRVCVSDKNKGKSGNI